MSTTKRYIKKFESFQIVKRLFDKANENVVMVDDVYRVGGIEVKQSTINAYIKRVKDETKKNLRSLYSDSDIAELLVKYVATTKLEPENIPASALLGGDNSMDSDVDMDHPEDVDVNKDGMENQENQEMQPTDKTEPTEPTEPAQPTEPSEESKVEDTFEEPSKTEEPAQPTEPSEEEHEEEKEGHEEEEEHEESSEEEEGGDNEELPI